MGRPAKTLEQQVRDGTFRARRHAELLAGPDLEQWPGCAALQGQYREAEDVGDRAAIALEFERAVGRAHHTVATTTARTGTAPGDETPPLEPSPATAQKPRPAVERLALSPNEASQALGVSRDFFDEHIAPELRVVRRGRRKLIDIRELQRWLATESAFALEGAS